MKVPHLGLFASGGVSLLLVGSFFVLPFLGLLVAPLGLLPILHHLAWARRGWRAWAWVVVALAGLSVAVGGGFPLQLLVLYLLVVVVPAVGVQLFDAADWEEGRWIAVTSLAGVVLCLGMIAAAAAPEPPVSAVGGWIRDAAAAVEAQYREMGVSQGEIELALDRLEAYGVWVAPSTLSAYLVTVLFWIRPRLRLLGFDVPAGSFEEYRSEPWLPAVFAFAGIGTLVLGGTPRWFALNLLLAVLMLYFAHGLAIIRAHAARWLGRHWAVRWLMALLCLIIPLPVAILGVADSFYELRPGAADGGER